MTCGAPPRPVVSESIVSDETQKTMVVPAKLPSSIGARTECGLLLPANAQASPTTARGERHRGRRRRSAFVETKEIAVSGRRVRPVARVVQYPVASPESATLVGRSARNDRAVAGGCGAVKLSFAQDAFRRDDGAVRILAELVRDQVVAPIAGHRERTLV